MNKSKILIIEDEKDLALVLAKRLTALGYEVATAFDAYQGFAKTQREKPDLIILDLMLPAGGGMKTLEHIKGSPHLFSIPVIVLTALQASEKRAGVLAAGADAFMEKPYDMDKLHATIQDLLRKTGRGLT